MAADSTKAVVDYSPLLLRSIWSLFAFATVFAGLRVVAKLAKHRPLQWDDHFLNVSWVSPVPEHHLPRWFDTRRLSDTDRYFASGLSPCVCGFAHQRCRLWNRPAFRGHGPGEHTHRRRVLIRRGLCDNPWDSVEQDVFRPHNTANFKWLAKVAHPIHHHFHEPCDDCQCCASVRPMHAHPATV